VPTFVDEFIPPSPHRTAGNIDDDQQEQEQEELSLSHSDNDSTTTTTETLVEIEHESSSSSSSSTSSPSPTASATRKSRSNDSFDLHQSETPLFSTHRCYCLISKFPFFQAHFNVLYSILGMCHNVSSLVHYTCHTHTH
jgi:hypothetical protein